MDLIVGQQEQGHEVALLWPGKMSFINNKLSIRNGKKIDNVESYEIINPLPISLDEGIKDITAYTKKCDKNIYRKFLQDYAPNAIHIHTLMGLHKEFLIAAQELNIKTVFTTHDYFGLCPTVTFFCNGRNCVDDFSCRSCVECNQSALSINKIKVMQSPVYRILKESSGVKFLRRKHRQKFFDDNFNKEPQLFMLEEEIDQKAKEYRKLRRYYLEMYKIVDVIHFNSSIAENIFKKFFQPKKSQVINITHSGIHDYRKKKYFSGKLKITYLAPTKPFKGFDILKSSLDELWDEGFKDFELNIFSLPNDTSPYMNVQNGYQYSELESIFNRTDLLVAPSVWYETFGYTVLEALSYGVPVLVSENVGAKDIVGEGSGWIINLNNKDNLKKAIKNITHQELTLHNQFIIDHFSVPIFNDFVSDIIKMYK